MKKLKWKIESGFIYNIWTSGLFEISQKKTSDFYRLKLGDGTIIHHAFKKLSTAQKVAQLIHNG